MQSSVTASSAGHYIALVAQGNGGYGRNRYPAGIYAYNVLERMMMRHPVPTHDSARSTSPVPSRVGCHSYPFSVCADALTCTQIC